MPGGDDGEGTTGDTTGGFGSAGGTWGPSTPGGWGPQNADVNGVSQYGGSYGPDGRVQVGTMGFGGGAMAPGEQAGHFNFQNVQSTPTTPDLSQYEGGMMTGWGVDPDTGRRQESIARSMEGLHGGGFMGSLGRGIGSLFGVAKELTALPDARMGLDTTWNPGSLAGLLPGPLGTLGAAFGQDLYTASGLPKPSLGITDPLEGMTLTDQIARR